MSYRLYELRPVTSIMAAVIVHVGQDSGGGFVVTDSGQKVYTDMNIYWPQIGDYVVVFNNVETMIVQKKIFEATCQPL